MSGRALSIAAASGMALLAVLGAAAEPAAGASAAGASALLSFDIPGELSGIGLSPWSAGLFSLPVLAWNAALASKLDMSSFPGEIPAWYSACENAARAAALAYPFARPLDPGNPLFVPGLVVYGAGLALYFASWLPLMDPNPRAWEKSLIAQLAPAYTPIIWLAGIALLSDSPLELLVSAIFVALHVGEYAMRWRPSRA